MTLRGLGAPLALAAWVGLGLLWPGPGADYVHLRTANLVLSVAAAAVVLARGRGWLAEGQERRALAGLAAACVLVYTNAFAFRLHYHELAHYYLGGKYFPELSYGTLYTALLRAEAEDHGTTQVAEARDLAGGGEMVPTGHLLARSQPVKDAFTPERWAEFRADAAFLRARLAGHYPVVFRDHGFNPSPLWAAIGGPLARMVPAGSHRGLRALAVLDALLIAAAFAALLRAFGPRAALLGLIHFCLVYGATFEWVGGAYLRYIWFAACAAALAALQGGRAALGGALLGGAATLRLFPASFFGALALGAGVQAVRARTLPRAAVRTALGFAGAVAVLAGLTALLPPGPAAWADFADNISRLVRAPMANRIGLGSAASTLLISGGLVTDAARLGAIVRALQVLGTAAAALIVARTASGRAPAGGAALGALLVFAALDLTAYYYVFLVLLTVVAHERTAFLSAAFAVEAASYALALAGGSDAVLYAHRSLLVMLLLLLFAWARPSPSGTAPREANP
jgi:hypothetical protein